jgi:hypothetical protein
MAKFEVGDIVDIRGTITQVAGNGGSVIVRFAPDRQGLRLLADDMQHATLVERQTATIEPGQIWVDRRGHNVTGGYAIVVSVHNDYVIYSRQKETSGKPYVLTDKQFRSYFRFMANSLENEGE